MKHVLWSWTGSSEEILFGATTASGTGQSGTAALSTTPLEVLTKAKSLHFTQDTSSGDGNVYLVQYLPLWSGVTKKRITYTFSPPGTDANFGYLNFVYREFDGSKYYDYTIKWNSNAGATEEIQYINSSGTLVDTGFTYPADASASTWYELQVDIDISANTYTFIRLNEQSLQSTIPVYEPANSSDPTSNIILWINGSTTASAFNIDSVVIEDIT